MIAVWQGTRPWASWTPIIGTESGMKLDTLKVAYYDSSLAMYFFLFAYYIILFSVFFY